MMHPTYDLLIVGAGIIGLSTAYYAANHGLKTAIIDRAQPGSGTTAAAAGMLGVQAELEGPSELYPLAKQSRELYAHLKDELAELTGTDIGWTRSGALKLAFDQTEMTLLKDIHSWQKREGEHVEYVDQETLQRIAPATSPEAIGGLHFPNEAHIQPAQTARALTQAIVSKGVDLYLDTTVIKPLINGVETTSGTLHADQLVIATGVDTLPELDALWDVHPIKGEIVKVMTDRAAVQQTLFYKGMYVVPKPDGELILGATSEASRNRDVTVHGVQQLLSQITTLIPSLKHAKITNMWAGLRPQSTTGLPFIGPHPAQQNCWLAGGHGRNGILLAPITGKQIVQQIMQDSVALPTFQPKYGGIPHGSHHQPTKA